MPPVPPGLEKMAQGLLRQALKDNEALLVKPTFLDGVKGFYHAIRWSEPWIVGLLALHCLVVVTVVLTRRMPNVQIALLLWICAMVWLAQHLNPLGAQHWRELGFTQNYFDPRGVFITALYSAPLLCIAAGQMLYSFVTSVKLLIQVKRAELVRGSKRKAAASAAADAPATPAAAGADAAAAAPPASAAKWRAASKKRD